MYIPGVFFRPQDLPQLMMPTWYHFLPDSWVQARGPPLSPCGQRTQISSEPRSPLCVRGTARLTHGRGLMSLPTPSHQAKSSHCQSVPAPPSRLHGCGRWGWGGRPARPTFTNCGLQSSGGDRMGLGREAEGEGWRETSSIPRATPRWGSGTRRMCRPG